MAQEVIRGGSLELATGEVRTDAPAFSFNKPVVGGNADPVALVQHHTVTLAEMNAGHTLLPAVTGYRYRLIDLSVVTTGANAAATANATGIAVYGTQAGSAVALFEVHLAALLRSIVNKPSSTDNHWLADSAGFTACDPSTAITTKAVAGVDLITSTAFDFVITYVLER